MDLELTGRRALVTGSSSGIGAGIAAMLAAEGAAVVIHGRDEARAHAVADGIAAEGGATAVICGDLSAEEGAARVAAGAIAALGGIDILVNNAGGAVEGQNRSWFEATPRDWHETYDRNVLSAVRLIRALSPAMKDRGWGRIINIGTGASITPTSAQADYGPAKAALLNMSLGLSKALKDTGVTSNTVSPGMIRTEGLTRFLTGFAARRGWGDDLARAEDYVAKGGGQTVKRIGEVRDIAYAVAFLASPKADFVNGINIHVDGGLSPSLH